MTEKTVAVPGLAIWLCAPVLPAFILMKGRAERSEVAVQKFKGVR